MKDLELLIETGIRLSNRLATMADNEYKFGFEVGLMLERLSYDQYVITNELKAINDQMVGGRV